MRAALHVFERRGLAGASMRAIAAEAGCTTGAIYPLFAGKEEIYAQLLESSLRRLFGRLAAASALEAEPLASLLATARAWLGYYLEHPAEGDLGLYLHGSGEVKGLGRRYDPQLNALLLQCLDLFTVCFQRLAPAELEAAQREAWARAERDLLFANLVGIQLLERSRRTDSIGTDTATLQATLERGLAERLSR